MYDHTKEDVMGWEYGTHGRNDKWILGSGEECEGKRSLGPRRRRADYIKMDLKDMGGGVEWIHRHRIGKTDGRFAHGNESSSSIKRGEFFNG